MCTSKYIQVQCKECGKQYMKREDSIKSWKGNCIPCGRKVIANMPHVKELLSIRSSGQECSFWLGGICSENIRIRKSSKYKRWREAVFERDNYTCQDCGIRGHNLQADHIKSFSEFPELRFDVDNGKTLCIFCHRKTPTWGINQFSKCLGVA